MITFSPTKPSSITLNVPTSVHLRGKYLVASVSCSFGRRLPKINIRACSRHEDVLMGIRRGKQKKSRLLRQIVSFPSLVVVITCCLLLQRFRWKYQVFGEERSLYESRKPSETVRNLSRICGNYICHQYLDGRRPHVDCRKKQEALYRHAISPSIIFVELSLPVERNFCNTWLFLDRLLRGMDGHCDTDCFSLFQSLHRMKV